MDSTIRMPEGQSEANLLTVEIPIDGIHCAGCVSRIEKALLNVEGVEDAAVNLAEDQTRVNNFSDVVTSYDSIDGVLTGLQVNSNFHGLGAKCPLGDWFLALACFGVEEQQTLGYI